MNSKRTTRIFMCDFETTVYENQDHTEVWAVAIVELFTENVTILHRIEDMFTYFRALDTNVIAFFHNLKFDGAFILDYLLAQKKYLQALNNDNGVYSWKKNKEMLTNEVRYSISDKGMWYSITQKLPNNKLLEFRDSLKLLPFSVEVIGKSFATKHKKLDMEYTGYRYAGCEITEKEREYIANDVLVVKEALEIMLEQGHDKSTIGSCCLEEFKKGYDKTDYAQLFPDIYKIETGITKYPTFGDYIRKSYRGGWCYLVRGKENKIYYKGTTADVNSLYPSMMHSDSGNYYPVGKPHYWSGNYIHEDALKKTPQGDPRYFFLRIRTRFHVKHGYLPFIQIKGSPLYRGTEMLETSDVYSKKYDKYFSYYYDSGNNRHEAIVEMVVTCTDYYLMLEHYDLYDFEIIDGVWFYAMKGIYDEYINKYAEIKKKSKGAQRTLAKLFLNNLYGKQASSKDSSFKIAYVKDDESLGFIRQEESNKKAGYIPCGSAITSYAREFTIRAAQKNYHGVNERGFIYADTDSIHCDLLPDEIVGIREHPTEFNSWSLESCWDIATFTRQKTYIEHVTHENREPIEEPFYDVKCAGMPSKCKNLFVLSMKGNADINGCTESRTGSHKEWTEEEKQFLFKDGAPIKRDLSDFKIGLKVPDKLRPKRMRGGVLLVNTSYEMR